MEPQALRVRARQEVDELGPEPRGLAERAVWDEERRGAIELLAALANWDQAALRRAALEVAAEWTDRLTSRLLIDASNVSPVDERDAT